MTKKTKILFLDFDGVCNSYREGSYVTNKNETYGPSKSICERIKTLCDNTGAKIIISSNWRKFDSDGYYTFDGNKVYNPLKKLNEILVGYIIGTLSKVRHVTKAEAIILWMEENDFDFVNEKWAIVDDDPSENLGDTHDYFIKDHYVQTETEFGLTEEKLKEVEKLLV